MSISQTEFFHFKNLFNNSPKSKMVCICADSDIVRTENVWDAAQPIAEYDHKFLYVRHTMPPIILTASALQQQRNTHRHQIGILGRKKNRHTHTHTPKEPAANIKLYEMYFDMGCPEQIIIYVLLIRGAQKLNIIIIIYIIIYRTFVVLNDVCVRVFIREQTNELEIVELNENAPPAKFNDSAVCAVYTYNIY